MAAQTRMVAIKALVQKTVVQTEMVVVGPETGTGTGTGTTMATETETVVVMEQETQVLEHLAAGQEPLAVAEPQVLLTPAVVCRLRHLTTLGQLVAQVRPAQVTHRSQPIRATEMARVVLTLRSVRALRMVQ